MKEYPKFPDPVEVPTASQNSKWMQRLRELKEKKEKRKEVHSEFYNPTQGEHWDW